MKFFFFEFGFFWTFAPNLKILSVMFRDPNLKFNNHSNPASLRIPDLDYTLPDNPVSGEMDCLTIH